VAIKKIFLSLVGCLVALTTLAGNHGELQVGVLYSNFGFDDQGTFTPAADGALTITNYTSDCVDLYYLGAKQQGRVEQNVPRIESFQVQQGKSYTIYGPVVGTAEFSLAFTSNADLDMAVASIDPANGSAIGMTGAYAGQVNIAFNCKPAWGTITVTAGSVTKQVPGSLGQGFTIFFETKAIVTEAISLGMQAGDSILIDITGICMAADSAKLLNGDGKLTIGYTLRSIPTELVSAQLPETFLSYYRESDPDGLIHLTFSDEIIAGNVYLKHGNIDQLDAGEYYEESLSAAGKVSVEGRVMTIDLRGRSRTRQEMMPGVENRYSTMNVHVTNVRDVHNQPVQSSGQGTVGSFTFSLPYEEISADIATDFTPSPDYSSLANATTLEVYVTDYDKMSFTGVRFEGEGFSEVVPRASIAEEPEMGGMVYLIPIPEAAKTAATVVVSFEGLEFADGKDHSALFCVTYTNTNAIEVLKADAQCHTRHNLQGQRSRQTQGTFIENNKIIHIK